MRGIRLMGRSYELNIQRNGVRQFINLETSDPGEAITRAEQIRANPELLPSTDGFSAEIDRFIAYKLRQREYTAHTARTKKNKLLLMKKSLPDGLTGATVATKQLQQWHDDLVGQKLATSTVHGYFMSAQAFFEWAIDIAKIRRQNPVKDVKLIKLEKRAREDFCSYEQRDALIRHSEKQEDDEFTFILFSGFHAGFRFNEISEAVPWWYDLPHSRIQLRKTDTISFKDNEERTIPLTRQFHAFLTSYGLPKPYMIQPEKVKGKWLYRYDFRAKFERFMASVGWCDCSNLMIIGEETTCRKCGQDIEDFSWVTPHIMRHTFASLLVSAGESIYKVAIWLGDDVKTVQDHYGHLAPDEGGIEKAFADRHKPPTPSAKARAKSPRG